MDGQSDVHEISSMINNMIKASRNRYLAIPLIGMSAWCAGKCLGAAAFYSSYIGESNGMERVLGNAHLSAVAYFWSAMVLAVSATALIARSWKSDDDFPPKRYLLTIFTVLMGMGASLALIVFLEAAALHHRS